VVILLVGFCVSGFDFAGFWATAGLLISQLPMKLTVLWQVAKPVATFKSEALPVLRKSAGKTQVVCEYNGHCPL
jgi:hypothetical protein